MTDVLNVGKLIVFQNESDLLQVQKINCFSVSRLANPIHFLHKSFLILVNENAGENGRATSLDRAEELTGCKITFYQCDLLEKASLSKIFDKVGKLGEARRDKASAALQLWQCLLLLSAQGGFSHPFCGHESSGRVDAETTLLLQEQHCQHH